MRVLMLGWEFPPNQSGGLGTACYGITRALLRKGTDVLFVMPYTHLKEHPDSHVKLRSASGTMVPEVVSRETLMEKLWESDSFVDDNTLTVNVNRLRRKLDAAGLDGFIATRFGVGYIVG